MKIRVSNGKYMRLPNISFWSGRVGGGGGVLLSVFLRGTVVGEIRKRYPLFPIGPIFSFELLIGRKT